MISRRTLLASPMLAAAPRAPGLTRFPLACMTLPYSGFPLERALTGIQASGYPFVAWGTSHRESGGMKPVMAVAAPAAEAARLGARCRSMGLEPVMMFATVNLEAANARDAHLRRLEQANSRQ